MWDRPARLTAIARHLGGPRVLVLPVLRALAVVAGLVWALLAPPDYRGSTALWLALGGFALYSGAITAGLWKWPGAVLRWNLAILAGDLVFALLLIRAGGARSALFLALLLIAALQSYYYGCRRGVVVAVAAAAGYLGVVWATLDQADVADVALRVVMLIATAAGVGLLGQNEEAERQAVLRLTDEARERERFIRGVVDHLSQGVVALDRDGRIVAWNRALERRHAVTASQAIGRTFLDAFPAYRLGGLAEPLRGLLSGEREAFGVDAIVHRSPGGETVIETITGSALRRGGRPAGAVLLIEDITARVHLERSARQAEKLAALGTMAAGLAHELNNPIGIISSRIEIMLLEAEARPLPADAAEDLRVLHRHAQRVARIAQGLLSFARQSSGRRAAVDLNHLVEDTLLLIEKQLAKDHIAIKRSLAPDVPPVLGDANALQQVLVNLLTNAREALAGRGEVAVETQAPAEQPGAARLVVRDTGPGIPPEALPRIFDPFFTTKAEGTGLGLSISYGIVREHQGSIDVQSRVGEGTTFILTFPPVAAGAAA